MFYGIRGKLIGLLTGSLLFTVVAVSSIAAYYNYSSGINSINTMLSVIANAATGRIRAEFSSPMTIVAELAGRPELQQDSPSRELIATLLAEVKMRNSSAADILQVGYADKHGNTLDGKDIADSPGFLKAQVTLKSDIRASRASPTEIPSSASSRPSLRVGTSTVLSISLFLLTIFSPSSARWPSTASATPTSSIGTEPHWRTTPQRCAHRPSTPSR